MPSTKVLFVAPRFHTNQFFLTKGLIEKGVEVKFLSVYIGGSENHEYIQPILGKPSFFVKGFLKKQDSKTYIGKKILRKYFINSFRQNFKLYRDFSPDIVIVRNFKNAISIQHLLLAFLKGKRIYLYTQRNYRQNLGFKETFFLKALGVLGIRHYTPVHGNESEPISPNTSYLPFVIETQVGRELVSSKLEHKGIRVVVIGKMEPRKKIMEAIEIMGKISKFNRPENELIIISECISDANDSYFKKIMQNIPPDIQFSLNFELNIKHEKVLAHLKKSDLFLLPSRGEPAAFSILEAMACGTAVICSDQNGTKNYIETGVNGGVFKFTEDLSHLETILKGMMDKKTLNIYGHSSLELVESNHSIDYFYKNIIHNS